MRSQKNSENTSTKPVLFFDHHANFQTRGLWVEYTCFSPSEELLAICSSSKVFLLEVDAAKTAAVLKHKDTVWRCSYTLDGTRLLTGTSGGHLNLWDLADNSLIYSIAAHQGCVFACTVHPKLDIVCTCGFDNTSKTFQIGNGQQISEFQTHSDSVEDVAFSADGSMLASCSKDKTLCLFPNFPQARFKRLEGHTNWVFSCKFSPCGKVLVSVGADGKIAVWSTKTCQLLHIARCHDNVVWDITFLHQSGSSAQTFATCSSDKSVRLWTITGKSARLQHIATCRQLGGVTDGTAQLYSCAWAPQRHLLAVSSLAGAVHMSNALR